MNRTLIIKVYGNNKSFHPMYFISPEDGRETQPIGTMTTDGMEKLHASNMLQEIPAEEINDTYFRHTWFLTDITTSKYYQLKLPKHGSN